MVTSLRTLGCMLFTGFAAAVAQASTESARPGAIAVQRDCIAIAKAVNPSVVCVRTFVRDEPVPDGGAKPGPAKPAGGWVATTLPNTDYPGFRLHGTASGFFAGDGGELLTCLQPLRRDGERLVDLVEIETIEGRRILCDVVGVEPTLELAVLRASLFLDWQRPEMRPLPFGDSDALEVGSWLLGFGDPAGPERFLATGLLTAKPARDCYQELMSSSYMQATMAVPEGAFGGPLVDLDGHVVGILMRMEIAGITTSSAWALPSKIVQGLYHAIREAGTTQSPWLGFSVMSRAEIATARGVQAFQAMPKPRHGILLENVFDPSPAHAAGLQPGDFLTHVAGVEIHAPVDFQRQLYLAGVGRKVALKLWRAGAELTVELAIAARPAEAKPR